MANFFAQRRNLFKLAKLLLVLLGLKVLLTILWEYRLYFPADFDATFLIGREKFFYGIYCWAFYAHIVTVPIAIVLGSTDRFS